MFGSSKLDVSLFFSADLLSLVPAYYILLRVTSLLSFPFFILGLSEPFETAKNEDSLSTTSLTVSP